MKRNLLMALAALVLGTSGAAHADQHAGPPYGANLMTQEEWQEHHEAMQQLSAEERLAYRQRVHAEMLERARERGIELPDEVPEWAGFGMGPGHEMAPGKGMAPGQDMRPGGGGMKPHRPMRPGQRGGAY